MLLRCTLPFNAIVTDKLSKQHGDKWIAFLCHTFSKIYGFCGKKAVKHDYNSFIWLHVVLKLQAKLVAVLTSVTKCSISWQCSIILIIFCCENLQTVLTHVHEHATACCVDVTRLFWPNIEHGIKLKRSSLTNEMRQYEWWHITLLKLSDYTLVLSFYCPFGKGNCCLRTTCIFIIEYFI